MEASDDDEEEAVNYAQAHDGPHNFGAVPVYGWPTNFISCWGNRKTCVCASHANTKVYHCEMQ